jgi:hypothetical protein
MRLLQEVDNMSSEDRRSGNTSQRNASADKKARKEATTEAVTIITEAFAESATSSKYNRNKTNECSS